MVVRHGNKGEVVWRRGFGSDESRGIGEGGKGGVGSGAGYAGKRCRGSLRVRFWGGFERLCQ